MDIPLHIDELKLIRSISRIAQENDTEAFIIGGFVRDKLLGRETKDMDVVCTGDGVAFAKKLSEGLKGVEAFKVFKNFGTAYIKLPLLDLEVVGARKESYREDSRNPEVSPGTIEDDQNRRDFTVNALAISLQEEDFGHLVDPFQGMADLDNKILRTPLKPAQTFSDDPLRMLRAIRFAGQLGFEIYPETLQAIKEENERIKILSPERVTDELNKILMTDKPSVGFKLLHHTGLLQHIIPELVALEGVDIQKGMAHKDNFYHSLEVLDNVAAKSDNLWLRWAGLLHDVGKAPTKKFDDKIGWTFHAHDAVGGAMVRKIFRRLKLPMHESMKYVKKLVELHLRPISLSKNETTDSAIRRLIFDAGEDIDDLMLLCECDITSKNEKKVERFLANFQKIRERIKVVEEKDHVRNWQPPISGEEIMETFGIHPSKEVGLIKEEIKEAILDGKIENNYDQARQFMIEFGEKLGLKSKVK